MKKIKIKLVVSAVLLGVCATLGSWKVNAEEVKNSLTVSPPHQSIVLVPGETYQGSIKVSSRASSDRETRYEVLVGSFSEHGGEGAKDDYGTVDYITESSYNQMMDWIELDETEGVVHPNETNVVPFKIHVPKDAPAGGQYASLIVRDSTPNYSEGEGVAVQNVMQILSIIYAEVAGDTRDEGEVIENAMPSFLLNSPLEATSMVRNNGNVHTMAEYTLQVWPLIGDEEYCTNEENTNKLLVMPETERYNVQSCELPAVGIFRAKQVVKIFGEESVVERTIVICPIWLLSLILLAIIAIIIWLVVRARARSRNNRKTNASSGE